MRTPNPFLQVPLALTAQARTQTPELFQTALINNISRALLSEPTPPCLLRAPTGSGKTFVMSQVLERVGAERGVLWFWFVPFVTLVGQTLDALVQHAPTLSPTLFAHGRNQDLVAGTVLISTAQAVAKAQSRTKGYDADGDDDVRTVAAVVARARAKGLQIGLVVDEAHIGLDKGTEFGKFAQWLSADYLLMATATPKDQRLTDFLAHAGYSGQLHFAVSRDDVVEARLNKKYIEAVVYSLGSAMQQLTDIRRTVLRQAWARNVVIGHELRSKGVDCVPLLLVQVGNGEHAVEEAAEDLMRHCLVSPSVIGKHSADEPDPILMAAIANDTTKQVLIFKQSAGTGFDAPRAFVLASVKPVNDVDFAMQFIGRVMRVARQVREAFPKPEPIPAELNTAFVYLGNPQSQAGFEAAVFATSQVKSELEGQTEKLLTRKTVGGGVVFTNRPTDEPPLSYSFGLNTRETDPNTPASEASDLLSAPHVDINAPNSIAWKFDLFGDPTFELDTLASDNESKKAKRKERPKTRKDVVDNLAENRLRTYFRKTGLTSLDKQLKSEEKPSMVDLSTISLQVAQQMKIGEALQQRAVMAALNRIEQAEKHTELTEGSTYTLSIQVVTDRAALARDAMAALSNLPHAEEEDYRIIVQVLSQRLRPVLIAALTGTPEAEFSDAEIDKRTRDAAHWVIRESGQELSEAIFEGIAHQAQLIEAKPLPDLMIFPEDIALEVSAKNIYGVLPPSTEDAQKVESQLYMDERSWWADQAFEVENGETYTVGRYDGAVKLNHLERDFARALDEAEFVHWWHRNPDKKPYSVRVVRSEHEHYFYPDFVVCLEHVAGEAPRQRLLETKENTKDAARKAKHFPSVYGKILFLTPDGNRLRWVNDDGSLGDVVRLSEMDEVRLKLAKTKPS